MSKEGYSGPERQCTRDTTKWQEQRHRGSKQGHSRQMVDTTREHGWSWACGGAVSKRQSQRGVMHSQTISIPGPGALGP